MQTQTGQEMSSGSKCLNRSSLLYQCIFDIEVALEPLIPPHQAYLVRWSRDSLSAGLKVKTNLKCHGAHTCHYSELTKPSCNWLGHARSFKYIFLCKWLPSLDWSKAFGFWYRNPFTFVAHSELTERPLRIFVSLQKIKGVMQGPQLMIFSRSRFSTLKYLSQPLCCTLSHKYWPLLEPEISRKPSSWVRYSRGSPNMYPSIDYSCPQFAIWSGLCKEFAQGSGKDWFVTYLCFGWVYHQRFPKHYLNSAHHFSSAAKANSDAHYFWCLRVWLFSWVQFKRCHVASR